MAFKDRAANTALTGTNRYVPAMQYTNALKHAAGNLFSLGTPAAVLGTAIAAASVVPANSAALTVVTFATQYVADSPYGRTITSVMSADPGAAGGVFDIYGWDYLGQRMVERHTHVNGSTAIQYGKKAFYIVDKVITITPATNAVFLRIGTGWRLGLPYKCDMLWARENNIQVPVYKRDTWFFGDRGAADAVAGSSKWFRPEFPGFVNTITGTPDGAGGATDPVVTVKLATVAITGLTVTIDTSDTAGLTVTDTPTTTGYNANNRFRPNDLIEVAGAAAANAKGDRFGILLTPTQFSPSVTTDPQTTTTGDPRGTYEALLTYDGVKDVVVSILGDPAVNAAGNGGLHGIRHVVS